MGIVEKWVEHYMTVADLKVSCAILSFVCRIKEIEFEMARTQKNKVELTELYTM